MQLRWLTLPRHILDISRPGGKMMITLAGAMSTTELGLSLTEMIHWDKPPRTFFERRVSAYQVAVAGEVSFSEAF